MGTAYFTNWTTEEFTGHWDGKPYKFPPGRSLLMDKGLAEHFSKHLTNRELQRRKPDGSLVYPGGETMTSPKRPEDVPLFWELFNKGFKDADKDEFGNDNPVQTKERKREDLTNMLSIANQKEDGANTIIPPDYDEDDDEESFGGKPVDPSKNLSA